MLSTQPPPSAAAISSTTSYKQALPLRSLPSYDDHARNFPSGLTVPTMTASPAGDFLPGGRHLSAEHRAAQQEVQHYEHAPVAVPHFDGRRPPPPAAHYRAARLGTGAPPLAPSGRGAASASARTGDEKELKSTRQQSWRSHDDNQDDHDNSSNNSGARSGSTHSLSRLGDQTPALHRDPYLSHSSINLARPIARRSASTPLDVDVEPYQPAPLLKLIPSADSSATILVDAPSRTDTPHPPGFMHTQENSDATTRAAFRNGNGLATDNSQSLAQGGMGSFSPDYAHDSIGKRSALSASSSEGGSTYANEFSHPPRAFSDYDITTPASVAHGSGVSEAGDGRRVKRKRKPAPPELLVIVRPPPSKDRNPLNLQIQLVVPQAPVAASRVSGESARDSSSTPGVRPGGELKRRGSSSSTRSGVSVVTNASSASSTGGGGRKVTPLYNLSFHTILPSTVSDAGTDQKVAKFSRKGVDVDGFGILEPHELVRGLNDLSTLESFAPTGHQVETRSPTQESQDGSLLSPKPPGSDPGVEPPSDVPSEPPTSYEAMTPEAKNEKGMGARFMRRFKGLSVGSAKSLVESSASTGVAHSIAPGSIMTTGASSGLGGFLSGIGNSARSAKTATVESIRPASSAGPHSIALPAARSSGSVAVSMAPSAPTVTVGAPTSSDVAPLVAGAGLSDGSRKTRGYYWTIRKLTRKVTDEHGNLPEIPFGPDGQNPVLRNVWRRFNGVNRMGGDESHPHPSNIPVRFEWTRETRGSDAKSSNGRSRRSLHQRAATDAQAIIARKRMSVASVGTGTTRSSFDDGRSASGRAGGGVTASLRPHAGGAPARDASNGNLLSPSPRVSSDSSALAAHAGAEETRSSYDSTDFREDDEDGNDSDPEDSETPWSCHLVLSGDTRIPIGTLSPAPHHPKVVAQLAVPFPLPDLSQTGLGYDRAGLTREEIKDIICVTCLHLVIRESFGGLGRAATKKDKR